jgi:hypothetical protein
MSLNRTWLLRGWHRAGASRRRFLAGALSCAAASCTSRTLPLPPPVVDSVPAPNAQGLVRVSGLAHENASVGVLNDSTMTGVIVTSPNSDCSRACQWEALVPARPGDVLRIWQFFETNNPEERLVPEP